MINTKFDLNVLAIKANRQDMSVLRYLFDTHIYKYVSKAKFKAAVSRNNSMVQIADRGVDHIIVRIKTEGVSETIV